LTDSIDEKSSELKWKVFSVAIEGRPHESAIASYRDVTKSCQRNDEINGCFQEPYSLELFKIEVIVSKRPPTKGCELLADGSSRIDL